MNKPCARRCQTPSIPPHLSSPFLRKSHLSHCSSLTAQDRSAEVHRERAEHAQTSGKGGRGAGVQRGRTQEEERARESADRAGSTPARQRASERTHPRARHRHTPSKRAREREAKREAMPLHFCRRAAWRAGGAEEARGGEAGAR
eukprot:1156534-Rhodomonas_salina.1